ncbi:PAS domain-containing sensor histidine kinase [Methanoregula sp.]|uniref:PAS domain-containing sensor histidine kinase n=1 Tax=Methanoregula sp. TaxID=2052170 RepID=UPI002371A65D|nr:PAS domain-containing sensor histidine kinase [Methanoregula sp.]MDD1687232.1 PAS domain-containing sensor histidine kinase [Methanoregula sp.]
MERKITVAGHSISHTDIVRICVIISLTLSCIFITSISLTRHVETIYAQLFYFPILYAAYFYQRRGLFLAGFCAVIYEVLAYINIFPDTTGMIYTTSQAILFICIAAVVAYFTEKINSSETRFRSIFEKSLLGIVLFDQNTFAIRMANDPFASMLGYSRQELGTMTFARFFHTKEEQRRFFEFLGSSEDVIHFETAFISKSERPVWVNLSWSRIDENLVSCSVIDITQRRLAEQAAVENHQHYEQVTEHAPTGIVIIRDNRIVYTNPIFRAFTGYDADELYGMEIRLLVHPDDQSQFPAFMEVLDSQPSLPDRLVLRFRTKTGDTRLGTLFFTWITRMGSPAILVNLVDVTEHERLKETMLLDNERRRGTMNTVAHELRAPLQPLIGNINLLLQNPETYGVTEKIKEILAQCSLSVDREQQIIDQMLELSVLDAGKVPLKYISFDLPALLQSVIDDGDYASRADLAVTVPAGLTFEADANRISVVLDAMLTNAVNLAKPPRKIRISYTSAPEDTMHRLAIQDNGTGISSAKLDEIFNQSPGNGNAGQSERIGMSLSIAKKYVQMHGGFISVDSTLNIGSTFTIHIPKHPQNAEIKP